jgi:hypothetical protein
MTLGLLLEGLVQPFGVVFDTGMTIAIPPSLKVSVVSIAKPVSRLVLRVPVTPALGPVDALPLSHWRRSIIAAGGRILPEPGLRLAPRQSVPARGLRFVALLVSRTVIKVTTAALSAFSIVPIPYPPIVFPAAKAVASTDATHAAVEALGALMAKALARFHGAPALVVLVLVAASPEAIVSAVSCVPAKPVASILRVVGAVAEIEAVGTILSVRVPESLLGVASSGVAYRGGRCRCEAGPWGTEDELVRVCVGVGQPRGVQTRARQSLVLVPLE